MVFGLFGVERPMDCCWPMTLLGCAQLQPLGSLVRLLPGVWQGLSLTFWVPAVCPLRSNSAEIRDGLWLKTVLHTPKRVILNKNGAETMFVPTFFRCPTKMV